MTPRGLSKLAVKNPVYALVLGWKWFNRVPMQKTEIASAMGLARNSVIKAEQRALRKIRAVLDPGSSPGSVLEESLDDGPADNR